MASTSSAIKQIADAASSPVRSAYSPSKKESEEACLAHILPDFRSQLCSRVLWTYLVLGLVLLAIVFYIFATAKADVPVYIGVRPSGVPGFVDNPWYIYFVISIVGVLYVYGMYRAYIAAGKSEATKYMLNLVFFAGVVLIIIWFYQFYRKGKINASASLVNDQGLPVGYNVEGQGAGNRICFYLAISIIALLVVQFYMFWQTGDRMSAYTVVPLVVVISLFAWASWELGLGVAENFTEAF
jgi:hypothetical protein